MSYWTPYDISDSEMPRTFYRRTRGECHDSEMPRTLGGTRRETLTVPEEQRLEIQAELAQFVAAREAYQRSLHSARKTPRTRGKLYKIAIFAPVEYYGQQPVVIHEHNCRDPYGSDDASISDYNPQGRVQTAMNGQWNDLRAVSGTSEGITSDPPRNVNAAPARDVSPGAVSSTALPSSNRSETMTHSRYSEVGPFIPEVHFDRSQDGEEQSETAMSIRTSQTVVESKVAALTDEIEFMKKRLESLEDGNSALLDVGCQTDDALLGDFLGILTTRIQEKMADPTAMEKAMSAIGQEKTALFCEKISKGSTISKESREEIALHSRCLAECDDLVVCLRIFSTQVRHLGPEGGVEQANLFGAKARMKSLLPTTHTMEEWKLWAASYMSTWGSPQRTEDDDSDDDVANGKFVEVDETPVDANGIHFDINLLKQPAGHQAEEYDEGQWVAVWSPEYQRCYYWNPVTDAVTWTEPVDR